MTDSNIIIDNTTLKFINIFRPAHFMERMKYGACFSTNCRTTYDRLKLLGIQFDEKHDCFSAHSNFKPMFKVSGDNYDKLEKCFKLCDTRNIERDRAFIDFPVTLSLKIFEINDPRASIDAPRTIKKLAIEYIVINVDAFYYHILSI